MVDVVTPIGRPLPDARQSSPVVAMGAPSGKSGNGKGEGCGGGGKIVGERFQIEGEQSRGRDNRRSGGGGKGADQVGEGGGASLTSVP